MSDSFQAASFPMPKRPSGSTQGISFHKGSFPDHFLGDLCVWARLRINMLAAWRNAVLALAVALCSQ